MLQSSWRFLPGLVSKSRPKEKAVSAAEDEVYESVIRDMVTPSHRPPAITQLVFADVVLIENFDDPATTSCKESARKHLGLRENQPPHFNTFADKIYRLLTGGWYDVSPRAETIQDFLDKSCTAGPLSRTFHTDLPRNFVRVGSITHFNDLIIENGRMDPLRLNRCFPALGESSRFHM